MSKKIQRHTPSQILLISFLIIISVGTIALLLPIATPRGEEGISFLEALFTSTSAVSVTGLSVLDVSKKFSMFGKTIIMILFQLGGLGIMTFSSIIMFLIEYIMRSFIQFQHFVMRDFLYLPTVLKDIRIIT